MLHRQAVYNTQKCALLSGYPVTGVYIGRKGTKSIRIFRVIRWQVATDETGRKKDVMVEMTTLS